MSNSFTQRTLFLIRLPDAVDDVKISLQLGAHHPERVQNAVLTIHIIVLQDGVQEHVRLRNAHLPRRSLDVLEILFADLLAIIRDHHGAPIIKAGNVRAGHRQEHAADHHVALLLRVCQRLPNALPRGVEVHDLAFAHAARRRLSDAEDLHRAIVLRLTDDGAHLGSADLEPDDDVFSSHSSGTVSLPSLVAFSETSQGRS
jgi:hypothetical protein